MKTRHKCKIEHALVFSIQNKHTTKIWPFSVWKYYHNKTLPPEKEPFFSAESSEINMQLAN